MISFPTESIFVITGASSGIGRSTALLFNRLGASVIAIGRNKEALATLKNESSNPDSIHIEVKDLLEDIDGLSSWIKSLKNKYGKLQGLICSAGVTETAPLNLINYNRAKILMDIDYFVPIMLAKGFSDRRINIGQNCSIIFIASAAASYGIKGQTIYSGAKGALISSMKILSGELYSRNIRVNSISPGIIDTPMTANYIEQEKLNVFSGAIVGNSFDISNIIVFLCSHYGKWINGQDIIANGIGNLLNHINSKN